MGGHWESKLGADEILNKASPTPTKTAQERKEAVAPEQLGGRLSIQTDKAISLLSKRQIFWRQQHKVECFY